MERICPYCLQPIQKIDLKYYVRKIKREVWETDSTLQDAFDQSKRLCERDNHYQQFWSKRSAEKIGLDMDRLVLSEQDLKSIMSKRKNSTGKSFLEDGRGSAAGSPANESGSEPGLLQDGRIRDNRGGFPYTNINGNLSDITLTGEESSSGLKIEEENGEYSIFLDNQLVGDTKRVCHYCWNVLPTELFMEDMRVIYISLVAGVSAGKSCLLLSWLRSIEKNVTTPDRKIQIGLNSMPERFTFRSLMRNDLDYPKMYLDILDKFENMNICPKKTAPIFVPPVFLHVEYKESGEEEQTKRDALLCIYDAAGEVMTNVDVKNQNPALMKHLEQTDAVIFLIDPDDVGLKTNHVRRQHVHLEDRIRNREKTKVLFGGRILDSSRQVFEQSDRKASQTLAEIMEQLMPDSREKDKDSRRKTNTEAAFLTLDGFFYNIDMKEKESQNWKNDSMRDKLMAFVVSKSDSFQEFYQDEYKAVFRTYMGYKGEERDSFEAGRRKLVREFFEEFYNMQDIDARYTTHREFLLSALGCEARETRDQTEVKLEGEYNPFRIEDPIHWIVKEIMSSGGK